MILTQRESLLFPVSGLLSAPRPRILGIEHQDSIVVDAVDQVWKILGTATHTILERANEGYEDTMIEERMYASVLGVDYIRSDGLY